MQQVNLHKSKMISLIIAAIGLISCFLPWWHVSLGGYGNLLGYGGSYNINGLHKLKSKPTNRKNVKPTQKVDKYTFDVDP